MTRHRLSLRMACLAGTVLVATCKGSTEPSATTFVADFITVRRAWQPGERDSTIAWIQGSHSLVAPFVGDISDLAPQLFADTDSVVVIVRNPVLLASRSAGRLWAVAADTGPAFDSTWTITGFDIRSIDRSQTPGDTILDVVGAFWAKVGVETYHGQIIADRCHSMKGAQRDQCMTTRPATTKNGAYVRVNTGAFEANLDTLGAGGGQSRSSTSEYWEAAGGRFEIKSGSYQGVGRTVTSGPYKGGLSLAGWVTGDLNKVAMPKVLPAAGPGFAISLDFRKTAIPSVQVTCLFPSPCTGP
jgi:hypothetical protein